MIHCGNCLDFLRNRVEQKDVLPFDLSITSPPYNKLEGRNKGELVKEVQYDSISDTLPEDLYQQQQIELCNLIYDCTAPGGHFFYNHKMRWSFGELFHPLDWLRKTKWCIRQEIIWNRTLASNIRGWRFWNIDERVYWLYKPVGNNLIGTELESKYAKLSTIWNILPERVNEHPAPYPIDIPTRIICSVLGEESNDNQLIYDPYSGSGTTWLAADLLGKPFIGTEVSEQYIKDSNSRIHSPPAEDMKRFRKELAIYAAPEENEFFCFDD